VFVDCAGLTSISVFPSLYELSIIFSLLTRNVDFFFYFLLENDSRKILDDNDKRRLLTFICYSEWGTFHASYFSFDAHNVCLPLSSLMDFLLLMFFVLEKICLLFLYANCRSFYLSYKKDITVWLFSGTVYVFVCLNSTLSKKKVYE
jgi:hypothetical protein